MPNGRPLQPVDREGNLIREFGRAMPETIHGHPSAGGVANENPIRGRSVVVLDLRNQFVVSFTRLSDGRGSFCGASLWVKIKTYPLKSEQ